MTDLLRLPHHDPSERYVSNPTPAPGEVVELIVEVADGDVTEAWLRTVQDGEGTLLPGEAVDATRWRFELPCDNEVMTYRFWLDGPEGPTWLTATGVHAHDPTDHHDFKLSTDGGPPEWVARTVWYQIFPDRFAASGAERELPEWAWRSDWDDEVVTYPESMTQIFGGDLDGIIEHLDHLVDLGVGGIYLTPVFPARSNHRYDATTFDHVDPLLGGDEALVRLREACDRVGLRLVCDITLNHTGDAHEWFRTAQADPDSTEAGFYYFGDDPDDYESWLGVKSLPKLDHSSSELTRRLHDGPDSVIGRFLAEPFRLDGWRVDVANMTGRLGRHDLNREVRRATRATFEAMAPDAWLLAEHFFDPSRDLDGPGWHGWMNYIGASKPILSWLGRPDVLRGLFPGPGQDPRAGEQVARTIDEVRASVPWSQMLGSMALLGSHDTARWHTIAPSPELAAVGLGLLMTLPGAPCFFYGDEIGLTGTNNEQSRTPMPWADRDRWDTATLDRYRSLVRFRAESDALAVGGLRWVERSDDALAFVRASRSERLLVRATRAAAPALRLSMAALGASDAEVALGDGGETLEVGPEHLTLRHEGAGFTVVRLQD